MKDWRERKGREGKGREGKSTDLYVSGGLALSEESMVVATLAAVAADVVFNFLLSALIEFLGVGVVSSGRI